MSEEVRLVGICSGGFLYDNMAESSRECGFQFKMSDGSLWPDKEFEWDVYEDEEKCVDLSNVKHYKNVEIAHLQSDVS